MFLAKSCRIIPMIWRLSWCWEIFTWPAEMGRPRKKIYLHAQELDPENQAIERQVALAEEESVGPVEAVPTDPAAIARMLERLTGRKKKVKESDLLRAARLLDQIIHSDSPAEQVASHLDEIDELLPALIELNIRQARADGRPDLAEALGHLQTNVELQLSDKEQGELEVEEWESGAVPHFKGSVLLLQPDLNARSNRMALLKGALETCAGTVVEKEDYLAARDPRPDVVIASNPHTNPRLLESLATLSAANVPIIIDLDLDFEQLPISNPAYSTQGLGIPGRSRAYMAARLLANMVTVPSDVHAASLQAAGYPARVLPDGWSRRNPMWDKKAASRTMINIGWESSFGQLEDLAYIRRIIIRVLREFSQTQIVVIGDPQAYRLFETVPENRRMYLPAVAPEERPYLFSQLDILLVPLRNIPFNLSLPDTVLVEAGAKGIPWIASPIPSLKAGVLAG